MLNIRLADQNPGNIGNRIISICSYPGNIGNLRFFHLLLSWNLVQLLEIEVSIIPIILEIRAAGGQFQGLCCAALDYFGDPVPGIVWHVQSREITLFCNFGVMLGYHVGYLFFRLAIIPNVLIIIPGEMYSPIKLPLIRRGWELGMPWIWNLCFTWIRKSLRCWKTRRHTCRREMPPIWGVRHYWATTNTSFLWLSPLNDGSTVLHHWTIVEYRSTR